jgi:radical SAM protein with 4Fe4S-binding SPASM domain
VKGGAERVRDTLRANGLEPPRQLTVAITGHCNLSCRHCWVESAPSRTGTHVPVASVLRLVQEFTLCGGTEVCLTGGEFFTHPGWRELLSGCPRAPGIRVLRLQTNGTLLDEGCIAALLGLGGLELEIEVSLEGMTAASHDRIRGPGAYARARAGILRLASSGLAPRTRIAFTEMRHNLGELPDLVNWADELGLAGVKSGALVCGGRAERSSQAEPPGAAQYAALVERYQTDTRFRDGCERRARIAAVAWHLQREERPPRACTFVANPYVGFDGRVFPCILCHSGPHAVSGAFDRGWADVLEEGAPTWARLREVSLRRSRSLAGCRECGIHHVCRGGCLGRAVAVHGHPMRPEDRCALRRAVYSRPPVDR